MKRLSNTPLRILSLLALVCLLGLCLGACGPVSFDASPDAQTTPGTSAPDATPTTPNGGESPTSPDAPPPSGDSLLEGIDIGLRAPDFAVELLDGSTVNLSDYRGRTVYLNFWATWCGPCVSEMPDIQTLQDENAESLTVLAINLAEDRDTVASFIERKGFTFPVGFDFDYAISEPFDFQYIPTTFVLDEEGIIRDILVGAQSLEDMQSAVDAVVE